MKKHAYGISSIVCASVLSCIAPRIALAAPAYMNDTEVTSPPSISGLPDLSGHLYPRTMMAETQSLAGQIEQYSKYDIIAATGGFMKKIASLQAKYPNLMYFRQLNAPEYLDGGGNCVQSHGMPFGSTGTTTGNCSIFAGHWLYQAGTTTKQSIDASATTLQVTDASRFTVGSYAVIYNAPAGSFGNAEHVKIAARNTSTNTLTLQRAYRSTAKAHGAGNIIAQHVLGQGGGTLNWSFNLSTQCPKDANGNTYAAAMINFIKNNANADQNGVKANVNVSGFLFDSDFHFVLASKLADVNNDLVRDDGVSASGTNWWGDGLDAFYLSMRNNFPNKYVVAGHQLARGFSGINGCQMEGWPQSNNYHDAPVYDDINARISEYGFYMHDITKGPVNSHVLTKAPTMTYPKGTNASSDKPFRLALGLGLMQNGYFATQNSGSDPDTWYDEFAVIVDPKSASYGQAVKSNPTDESAVRANRGWLGNPLGVYTRIYDASSFDPSQSLITPGTFDSDLNGWSGTNVTISRDTSSAKDGAASLRTSTQQKYNSNLSGAQVKGPTANLTKGTAYTLVFSAKSNVTRAIKASVGSHGEQFLTGPTWRRYIMAFDAPASGSQRITFAMGEEASPISLDSVYLFQGNPNVLRRDFQNGIVIANATPDAQYVSLGGTFQRIKGFQDPSVNNGATVTSLTLQPWDAAILVRPKGSVATTLSTSSTTTATPSTTTSTTSGTSSTSSSSTSSSSIDVCGQPTYSAGKDQGVFIWKDCSADTWEMRVTAGGNASGITYSGAISSTGGFSVVNQVAYESEDALTMGTTQISYKMNVYKSGVDGFTFVLPSASKACFGLQSPASAQVFLGPNAVSMPMSFDLNTLKSCSSSAAADTLSVVQVIYFTADKTLWIRADSDATPAGSSVITAAVLAADGTPTTLGQVGWNAGKKYYQQNFNTSGKTPAFVVLASEAGGTATARVSTQ